MLQVAILLESSHGASRGLLRGIIKYVRLFGPWGLHITTGGPGEQQLPALKKWGATGIIGRIPNETVAQAVVAAKLPTVLFDPLDQFLVPEHSLSKCSRCRRDNRSVGRLAAEHFLGLSFQHFAVVPEPLGTNWGRERCETFTERLKEEGKNVTNYRISPQDRDDWGLECRRMIAWLHRLPKPVAVFAPNDVRSRRILDACLLAGIKVPHQVTVLGVDNDELICESTEPPMSSISIDTEAAGYAAAEILDGLMRGTNISFQEVFYRPKEIVQRASTELDTLNDPIVLAGRDFIRINRGLSLRVADVVKHLKLSRRSVELRFKKALGRSVLEEIQRVRLETIRNLVAATDTPFRQIALLCGFECISHFGRLFKTEFGVTPSQYREEQEQKNTGQQKPEWSVAQ